MLLTEYNICYYLLDKGMITPETLVAGNFSARRSDSRNNNFIINKEYDVNRFFIKQIKANEAEKIETLRTEANCYMLANANGHYKILKDFLPKFYHYDPFSNVLIIEQVKDTLSVHDYYFQVHEFKNILPQLLADSLASYHVALNNSNRDGFSFRQQKPWMFTLTTAPPLWPSNGTQPSVEQQVMQLIFKNVEFVQLLGSVDKEWQPQCLVHNDVKFNNFLLDYDSEQNKINSVKQIDWELADVGDPLWDVAGIMQSYLFLWLSTDLPPQEQQQYNFRKISVEEVQPCIAQFWKRYVQQAKLQANEQLSLIKAVKYVALKLIHVCFELAPAATTLQPTSVKMLQMSFNILRSPANAAVQLLGIK